MRITELLEYSNDMKNDTLPSLDNYIRLFSFYGSIPFVFSHQFVEAASGLGYLAYGDEHSWISYMLKSASERAGQDGLGFYGNKEKYLRSRDGLYRAFEDAKRECEIVFASAFVSREHIERIRALFKEYRFFYTRTEFFYTDKAFELKDTSPDIASNFKSFDKLKLDGRQYLNELFLLPGSYLARLLRKLETQFFLPAKRLEFYSMAELVGLFEGNQLSDREVENRKAYLMYAEKDELKVFTGDTARDAIRAYSVPRVGTIVTGKTASKGKASGRARVIKVDISRYAEVARSIQDMQQGEILVAETTEPSVILACKKAAAIITNQGGMMSHAAIISRELRIPCIIGASNATDLIATGDYLEVDADAGVVTITK